MESTVEQGGAVSVEAIYRGQPFQVIEDDGVGVWLRPFAEEGEGVYVEFGERTLVIEPEDDEWTEAINGNLPTSYVSPYLMAEVHELLKQLHQIGIQDR
jgi:hypothetical protein